jgi:hypothetical protein
MTRINILTGTEKKCWLPRWDGQESGWEELIIFLKQIQKKVL